MIEIDNILKKHDLRTNYYKRMGKATLINSNKGLLILKPKIDSNIYSYLDSRSFNYYPKKVIDDNEYDITEYIDDISMPEDQKILDLINLVSLLHNKTTYYKNVTIDDFKKNYEDIKNNIEYLSNYYNDLISIIESKVYMSPAELLLASNISIILSAISFADYELNKWYKLIENKNQRRYVVLHNNLKLDHFIKNKSSYLISWDKSTIDIPIYDLYKLYKSHATSFDFKYILEKYEQNYPLLEEEKKLFFILISLPDKIDLNDNLYNSCLKINKMLDYLYKTNSLISPYYLKDTKSDE